LGHKCRETPSGVHEIGMRVALASSDTDATAARLALSAAWNELSRDPEKSAMSDAHRLEEVRQGSPSEDPRVE
jgi:hypothetical protein